MLAILNMRLMCNHLLVACAGWLLATFGVLAPTAAATVPAAGVGEVTFVIGVASRTDASGATAVVTKGMRVNVADRIETETGGHVHVKFLDGAFISVRPGSLLRVDEYRVDNAKPQDSAIRFTLERGVSRSITGDAGRVAKDRFRLNTPIAAIGVRGTDFVTLAQPDTVRATVNSGAVVLAPFGEGCVAESLGPCSTAAALALSADMGRQMLEYRRLAAAPRLLPVGREQAAPDQVAPPAPQEPRESVRSAASESHATSVVAAAPSAAPKPIEPVPTPTPIPTPTPTPTPPPAPTPAPEPSLPPSLVWGRYAQAPIPGDAMTVPYATARAGYHVTVGNDDYVLLQIDNPGQRLAPNLGRVDFGLKSAQASFTDTAGAITAAKVDGGWLRIDFDAYQFSTHLDLSHATAGSAVLVVDGSLRDDGLFGGKNSTGWAAGATSLDGKDAAYLFERYVPRGTFSGITLWKR